MIHVKNLFKRFGAFEVLKHLSFDVAEGEAVGLLGENGAGKSTTMKTLACFLPPSSGTVEIAGHEVIFDSLAVRRLIGYLPENVPLYGSMRVSEFLRYRAGLKGIRGGAAKEAMDRVLSLVELHDRKRSLIQTLSKGLRQRVGIADALIHSPKVLILDEPTSGLDPSQRREVRRLIANLNDEHTVLISSHILPEIEATCGRVIVINQGRVVAQSSIEDLRSFGPKDHFRVVFQGDLATAQQIVADLEGVECLAANPKDTGYAMELTALRDRELREALLKNFVQADFKVSELAAMNRSLEDVFMNLIGKSEEGGTA